MSEQEPEQPDLTPQPSQILAEPATPAACQQDYAQAADIRERLGWKDSA
ncbi:MULTISPECIES: hypothetical protein [Streptomyces]|nr:MULTISPECIES: hypothetical protein [Streptomyces]MBK3524838.1 hypothetical protein [Streptomyces sp. MBT70]GGR71012.1 hypothetical protein GCM10010236_26610 [Streptomyces eurythermus]